MISVIATVGATGVDHAAGNYNVSILVGATDGTVDNAGGFLAQVPFSTNPAQRDALIRTKIAAYVLATWGWVIAPADIFVPLLK